MPHVQLHSSATSTNTTQMLPISKKTGWSQAGWHLPLITEFWRQRQMNLWVQGRHGLRGEFKAGQRGRRKKPDWVAWLASRQIQKGHRWWEREQQKGAEGWATRRWQRTHRLCYFCLSGWLPFTERKVHASWSQSTASVSLHFYDWSLQVTSAVTKASLAKLVLALLYVIVSLLSLVSKKTVKS